MSLFLSPPVDVVLVLDHERLTLDLQRDLPKTTEIVPLPKSAGVSVYDLVRRPADRGCLSLGGGEDKGIQTEEQGGCFKRVFLRQEATPPLPLLV